jgi:cellulose synthase (UDP-forming)
VAEDAEFEVTDGTGETRYRLRRPLIRILVASSAVLGAYYLLWRIGYSINWANWFIAVPLIVAESHSYVDAMLFGLTMWQLRERPGHPEPLRGRSVDIMITTYNEPAELVRMTARHAKAVTYPHNTYILDDGASVVMKQMAQEEGVGYLIRSPEWKGKPRHAKAGNLNNALLETTGEFILILDADQLPMPWILDHTLGYFADADVAFVQTPQFFYNVPRADPLGSQAPLFYGPIQQGKDGWNAAFFCGSNAVLRREALMRLGIMGYVHDVRAVIKRVLQASGRIVSRAQKRARKVRDEAVLEALDELDIALERAREELSEGLTAQEITHRFQAEIERLSRRLVARDLNLIRADLAALGPVPVEPDPEGGYVLDEQALRVLTNRDLTPLGAIESIKALVRPWTSTAHTRRSR